MSNDIFPAIDLGSDYDTETKTKFGIEKVNLMLKVIEVVESRGNDKLRKSIDRLKSFLVQQMQRGLTRNEEIGLLQALRDYSRSEPATDERAKSMERLFDLEFIDEPKPLK